MKLIKSLITLAIFLALIFVLWWVFIIPTPISVPVSKDMALQYVTFKPIQIKAVYVDDLKNERLIPVYQPYTDKGNIIATYHLGRIYYELPTPPQSANFAKAVGYFRTAAEAGWPDAQNAFGVMLMEGQGVTQNLVEAYKWFAIAAQTGHSKAQSNLAIISSQMTMDQVYKGEELATFWIDGFVKVNENGQNDITNMESTR